MDYVALSKDVSYALRHAPWEYELEMDEEGWVGLAQLVDALRLEEKWRDVEEEDLGKMLRESEKKRFEITDGRIRAYYGHSFPMRIRREAKRPPDVLYHGTARRFLESIRTKGLLPNGRQYVHLSEDVETARSVGRRHDAKPCILVVDAKKAWGMGVAFYEGNEKVWLADRIPYDFIDTL